MGSQYSIGRHEDGLTDREREVVVMLAEKKSFRDMAKEKGGSYQRYHQLAQSLIKKGVLAKTADGTYVATIPLERSGVFRRLQAESAAPATETPTKESPSDHEAHTSNH